MNSLVFVWDLVVDGNGIWGFLFCVIIFVKCSEEGIVNIVGKNCKIFDYKVKCNYYKY